MSVRNAISITILRHCSAACFPIVTILCCELAKVPFTYPVHCGDSILELVVAKYSCVLSRSNLLFSIFKPHAEISQPGLTEHGFAAAVALRLLRSTINTRAIVIQRSSALSGMPIHHHLAGQYYISTVVAQCDSIVMIAPITLGRRQHPNMQAGLPWP